MNLVNGSKMGTMWALTTYIFVGKHYIMYVLRFLYTYNHQVQKEGR